MAIDKLTLALASGKTARSVTSQVENWPTDHAELQLLIACARTTTGAEATERIIGLLNRNLDWTAVISQAEVHGLMPLLYWHLRNHKIPAQVGQRLKEAFQENAEFNLYRTQEMLRLLNTLEAEGIAALNFKGPLLANYAYGNIALRQFGDLDILVKKHQLHQARKVLLANGYELGVPLTWIQDRFPHLSSRKDNTLIKRELGIVVELHCKFSGSHFRFPLSMQQLLPRLQRVTLGGAQVHSISPEILLLYLCVHGSRHSWERILWVADVSELIRATPAMDWSAIAVQAWKLGVQRTLAVGLLLARDLLGAAVPDGVWRDIPLDEKTKLLVSKLKESLSQGKTGIKGIAYWRNVHLQMRERLSDRLRIRWHYARRYFRSVAVPNAQDRAMVQLPGPLSFLYYLLRSLRLTRKILVSGFKRTTRNS